MSTAIDVALEYSDILVSAGSEALPDHTGIFDLLHGMWAHDVTSNSDCIATREQYQLEICHVTGSTGDDLKPDLGVTNQVLEYAPQIGNDIAGDIFQLSPDHGIRYV